MLTLHCAPALKASVSPDRRPRHFGLSPRMMESAVSHHQRLPSALRADCSRCAGLCCVVPAFRAVQGFGFDKPPHVACRHLLNDSQCSIHDRRVGCGFVACVGFDCYGGGQRVVKELGVGMNWRGSADNAALVFSAYTSFLVLHRLMATLTVAATGMPPKSAAQLRLRRMQLNRLCRTAEAKRGRLDLAKIERETFNLIRNVRSIAGGD